MKSLQVSKQKPSDKLSAIIDAYWVVKNPTRRDVRVPILPDGCIDIVMQGEDILLVGVMAYASIQTIEAGSHYLGIRFKPAVLASLLKVDISKYNDTLTPLQEVDNHLSKTLLALDKEDDEIFKKLDRIFESCFERVQLDRRIMITTQEILSKSGDISLATLCQKIALSQKQLERLFLSHVGLTPKKFARIIRFFHTHKHLSKEGLDNLCFKVLEKGYYDQAHFNREYKALTGLTPSSEEMSIFYESDG